MDFLAFSSLWSCGSLVCGFLGLSSMVFCLHDVFFHGQISLSPPHSLSFIHFAAMGMKTRHMPANWVLYHKRYPRLLLSSQIVLGTMFRPDRENQRLSSPFQDLNHTCKILVPCTGFRSWDWDIFRSYYSTYFVISHESPYQQSTGHVGKRKLRGENTEGHQASVELSL